MEIKKGVQLAGLQIEMRPVLMSADVIWRDLGRAEGVTVTCTTDGVHSAGSLHPYGYAVDLRTNYFDPQQVRQAGARLRNTLPHGYDVILHSTHIHVEYDMAKLRAPSLRAVAG